MKPEQTSRTQSVVIRAENNPALEEDGVLFVSKKKDTFKILSKLDETVSQRSAARTHLSTIWQSIQTSFSTMHAAFLNVRNAFSSWINKFTSPTAQANPSTVSRTGNQPVFTELQLDQYTIDLISGEEKNATERNDLNTSKDIPILVKSDDQAAILDDGAAASTDPTATENFEKQSKQKKISAGKRKFHRPSIVKKLQGEKKEGTIQKQKHEKMLSSQTSASPEIIKSGTKRKSVLPRIKKEADQADIDSSTSVSKTGPAKPAKEKKKNAIRSSLKGTRNVLRSGAKGIGNMTGLRGKKKITPSLTVKKPTTEKTG